jgi:hypothetical protein
MPIASVYSFRLSPHVILIPHVPLINHPSINPGKDNIRVAGIRARFEF